MPPDNVLRFLPPQGEIEIVRVGDPSALNDAELAADLQGHFVLVGIDTPADRFDTPFGEMPGTKIQAFAIHSLLTGHFITRLNAAWSTVLIFCGCFALLVFAIQQRRTRWLVSTATLLTVAVTVCAAVSMYLWLIWIDVVYAAAAFWVWTLVLIATRRRMTSPSVTPPAPAPPAAPPS